MDEQSKLHKINAPIASQGISGTKARAAAAEHAINGIKGIDSMTLRQAETAIKNRTIPMLGIRRIYCF